MSGIDLLQPALAGFFAGLSLIIAIGAQNAYVLRLGLARHHVGVAVAICAIADALLITAGVAGIGGIIRAVPVALTVITWVGVAYLVAYALQSFWRARRPGALTPAELEPPSLRTVALTTLAFTFLNPHVYLDTVLLLGSLANGYGPGRWAFAVGAAAGSVVWFTTLGYGARALAPLMARPVTWRILDVVIGLVMLWIAWGLVAGGLAVTPAAG